MNRARKFSSDAQLARRQQQCIPYSAGQRGARGQKRDAAVPVRATAAQTCFRNFGGGPSRMCCAMRSGQRRMRISTASFNYCSLFRGAPLSRMVPIHTGDNNIASTISGTSNPRIGLLCSLCCNKHRSERKGRPSHNCAAWVAQKWYRFARRHSSPNHGDAH